MKITVLTPTYRLLYKDKQIEALKNQTFKDFEWIIVDDAYEENKGIEVPFPLIHIPPNMIVPYVALSAAMNDGLVRANGKYVLFMNDYVIPEPTCLARHWGVQERLGGCMLSGCALNMDNPPPECYDERGALVTRDYRMGIFGAGYFHINNLGDGVYEAGRDGVQNWWAGRNDSTPLSAILECNGFDEAFDGRWGGHDSDMGNRLMTYGLKYYIDTNPINTCKEYDHPRGNKKECRSEAEQQALHCNITDSKTKAGVYVANSSWFVMLPRDLKEERKLWKQ